MEHCMIDGKRCMSCCCEVLGFNNSYALRKLLTMYRRGSTKEYLDSYIKDGYTISKMLVLSNKRKAKKINKHMVSIFGSSSVYFKCKNLTAEGCSIYKDRPNVCSGYPYYGKTEEEFKNSKAKADYRDDCTWFINL